MNRPSAELVSIVANAAFAPNVGSASHYDLRVILGASTGDFASADCNNGSVDGASFPAYDTSFDVDVEAEFSGSIAEHLFVDGDDFSVACAASNCDESSDSAVVVCTHAALDMIVLSRSILGRDPQPT